MPGLNLHVGQYHCIYNEGLHLGTLMHSLVALLIFPDRWMDPWIDQSNDL